MIEPARRPSRADMLRGMGIDVEGLRRESEKSESGCVIRSLQSVLGVRATDAEWERRLKNVRALDGFSYSVPIRTIMAIDRSNIRRLLETISTHNTPLGIVLNATHIDEATLTGEVVRSKLVIAERVCVIGGLVFNGELAGLHMAHIELDGEKVISKSDENIEVKLDNEARYPSFVFTPKKQA